MAVQIQLRRGPAAEWTSANPVLAEGEIAVNDEFDRAPIDPEAAGQEDHENPADQAGHEGEGHDE